MRIYRVRGEEEGFTIIQNHVFRDKGLSLKAKGLYCLMWSLPDDWDMTIEGLVPLSVDGRDAVKAAMKELETCGFLARRRARISDGTFECLEYNLYQSPQAENPPVVKPLVDKPTQLNTIPQYTPISSPILSKVTVKESSKFIPPTVEEVRAYCQERGNGLDPDQFIDFYTAKGWKIGNNPMKDWKAAVRTWEKRERPGKQTSKFDPFSIPNDPDRYKPRDDDFSAAAERLMHGKQPDV